MKNVIIGIAGHKGCGKDTVASMINYIFAIGISKANYSDWITKRASIDNSYSDRIMHFADALKDVLSIIYCIPKKCFYDREYKDELYFNLKSYTFFKKTSVENNQNAIVIDINMLKDSTINHILKHSNDKIVFIKLRTLMQYFGTDVCKNILAEDIWIRKMTRRIIDKAEHRRLCIIPDVRFQNEVEAITNNTSSLYGGVIKINRNICNETEHSSENINIHCDFEINNNDSLFSLFYEVLNICQIIYHF